MKPSRSGLGDGIPAPCAPFVAPTVYVELRLVYRPRYKTSTYKWDRGQRLPAETDQGAEREEADQSSASGRSRSGARCRSERAGLFKDRSDPLLHPQNARGRLRNAGSRGKEEAQEVGPAFGVVNPLTTSSFVTVALSVYVVRYVMRYVELTRARSEAHDEPGFWGLPGLSGLATRVHHATERAVGTKSSRHRGIRANAGNAEDERVRSAIHEGSAHADRSASTGGVGRDVEKEAAKPDSPWRGPGVDSRKNGDGFVSRSSPTRRAAASARARVDACISGSEPAPVAAVKAAHGGAL